MKRLSILRHAKAAKDDPSLADFDRPLTETGRADAAAMGVFMAGGAIAPDCLLSSPSRRTRETFERLAPFIEPPAQALFPPRLYNAQESAILEEIRAAPDEAQHLLLIGHNPGLHRLALGLANKKRSSRAALAQLDAKFPPGAIACFEAEISHWFEIGANNTALVLFKAPLRY
ncbi:MAG: histidine phosphatase family protein [Amphiplicatus sp.]